MYMQDWQKDALCACVPRHQEKTKRKQSVDCTNYFYHVRELITSVFSVVRLRTFYKSCFENVYNEYYMLHHIMIIKSKQKNFSLVYYSVRHILKSDLKYFGILKWACTNTKRGQTSRSCKQPVYCTVLLKFIETGSKASMYKFHYCVQLVMTLNHEGIFQYSVYELQLL